MALKCWGNILFIYLLTYFWLLWVFVVARGLSLVAVSGGYSSLRCEGFSLPWFSCCRARTLGTWASVVVARGLSSCGSWALERRLSGSVVPGQGSPWGNILKDLECLGLNGREFRF